MSSPSLDRFRRVWRRLSSLDRFALIVAVLFGLVWLARAAGRELPLLLGTLIRFFFYFFIGGYVLYRLSSLFRIRLLWSLRNRLVVAYLFIAVVPILLMSAMAGFSAGLVYQQLAAYLLYNDLQSRITRLQAVADGVYASLPSQLEIASPEGSRDLEAIPSVAAVLSAARGGLPGLSVDRRLGPAVLKGLHDGGQGRFAGLVQFDDQVWLVAAVSRRGESGPRFVSLSVPLAADLLDRLVPELGPVQFRVTRPPSDSDAPAKVTSLGNSRFVTLREIATRGRFLPPQAYWLDFQVKGVTKFEAVLLRKDDPAQERSTLFGSTISLASILNRRLFTAPGDVGSVFVTGLFLVGIIFLLLEVAALVTGVKLTRTITQAVDNLYSATQLVQSGDFSHRVRVQSRDQLGVLGDSFNAMTSSISTLIEEQRQRQRLENELSIAREVQSQLFPRQLPAVPGVELAALCRAARMVSGDYYDFVQLGPHRIGMAVADISGKGISAALLMASLQAAFRSQLLLVPSEAEGLDGSQGVNTADLVTRLNRHLFLNSSDDRYATLFYAVYDSSTRMLHYTNAGHLPPLLLAGEWGPKGVEEKMQKLEEGGMVVGLFDDCVYEQGSVAVEPGSLLVAYSDGMTEPENVYGEQFGARRLAAEVVRHRQASPQRLAELLLAAAEEWGQAPEQADDMTVVVARLG
ncbi:MAG: SpoIIE family protein phosphatase [Acidobacteria bacterium]|nr:SpoIIE family protein phosphatase [Acidobacteriota bacterium]MBI3662868.1 SpoIIE family protein phosphatase [Acidobacteriota bacterium]